MFGLPGRAGSSPEQRMEIQDYLREALPLMESLEKEYQTWLEAASEDSQALTLQKDPDGQHAAVYLWRVGREAAEFVQKPPVRAAKRFHEAFSLCLEARGAAADFFKEAADLALIKSPGPLIGEANKKLVEARRQWDRAQAARQQLEGQVQDT